MRLNIKEIIYFCWCHCFSVAQIKNSIFIPVLKGIFTDMWLLFEQHRIYHFWYFENSQMWRFTAFIVFSISELLIEIPFKSIDKYFF